MADKIALGARVRDRVTGFVGVVICRSEWLHGEPRLGVQPLELNHGNLQDPIWIDEARVEVVE